ncbi:MAG: hypothetical protein C0601_12285 [Candidatus Muiribacterium halophilum]|uniref:Uncharacterized protein n=1 Tax=Muiribacterium halophilum TaxID=2053465 RepID=A0A2N5ZAQ3_MUIH1|nr:MAG: hypothetical protein C0601_12285 [Candidatus Muirbacterium halophilum]
MKESLYLRKKITELTERISFLKRKIVILEQENLSLRKRISSNRTWFQKIKDILTGKVVFEIEMPWSKKQASKISEEYEQPEKIRKIG